MKKILVAVDFSKCTASVVEQATLLAKGLSAKVWIVHVTSDLLQAAVANTGFYGPAADFVGAPIGDVEMTRELCAQKYKREHHALLHLSETMRKAGIDTQAMLLKGDAAERLLEQAENHDVNMIVMGSHGHGLLRKMITGSVTEAVLKDSLCNVLIVPAPLE